LFRTLSISLFCLVFTGSLSAVAEAYGGQTHRVAAGESLASIAAREHISLNELARLNDIEGGARTLPAGTVLALTPGAATADPAQAVSPASGASSEWRAMSIASEMPTVDADLHMWTAPARDATPLFAAGSASNADTIHRFARGILSRTSSLAMSLTRDAMRYIGTPYVFGGTSPSGFDCSGYVQHVFGMLGIALPRTADAQFYAGRPTRGHIVAGDLVFFQTYLPGPSHVGIYLGTGRFIHSSSHGVMISHIRDRYWAARYLGSKRVSARVAKL